MSSTTLSTSGTGAASSSSLSTLKPYPSQFFLTSIIGEVIQPLTSATQGTSSMRMARTSSHGSWLSGAVPLPPLITLLRYQCHSLSSDSRSSLNTWLWPACLVYHLPSCQRVSLAHLVILRALSRPLLYFPPRMMDRSSRTYRKPLKWLFRWYAGPAALSRPCARAVCRSGFH